MESSRSREESSEDSNSSEKERLGSNPASTHRTLQEFFVSVLSLHSVINPEYDPSVDSDPLKAAERTGSRVYTLEGHHNENIRFALFGCHGDGGEGQKAVAAYLKKLNESSEKPDFAILLGDNFYPHGVDSPTDHRFLDQFYKLYDGIRCFVVPGNHCFGYTNEEKVNKVVQMPVVGPLASAALYYTPFSSMASAKNTASTPAGKERGMHQVTHSYSIHKEDPPLPSGITNKAELYRQSELNLPHLPLWNMPALYYSVIVGNLQMFFLDSNHIADAYFTWSESNPKPSPEKNQISWLLQEIEKCRREGRTPIALQHHPLHDISKRSHPSHGDAHQYFKKNPTRWNKLAEKFQLNELDYHYDLLLSAIYRELTTIVKEKLKDSSKGNFELLFEALFAAHVHAFYNYVSPTLRQFVAGGGGGKLQERCSFEGHEDIGYYLKDFGLMTFSCNKENPGIMKMNVYALHETSADIKHHLTFTQASHIPITEKPKDAPRVVALYDLVLKACQDYSKTLKTAHYKYDVETMHEMMAYFSGQKLPDAQTLLYRLQELMEKMTVRTNDSLYSKINDALKRNPYFNKSIDDLLEVNVAEPSVSTTQTFVK